MPSPDIIIEPIDNNGNGEYQFNIKCTDITKLELIRYDVKIHLHTHGHTIIEHEGKL